METCGKLYFSLDKIVKMTSKFRSTVKSNYLKFLKKSK